MAKRFTRNIDGVRDITKLPLDVTLQNDLVSDGKDVYVKNGNKYEKITGKSGGYAGDVIAMDFIPTTDGSFQATATMFGDKSINGSDEYFTFGVMFSNGNKSSSFFKYDQSQNLSTATITIKEADLKGRDIDGIFIEAKNNTSVPQFHQIISYKQIVRPDYADNNPQSPFYIKNKPPLIILENFNQENVIYLWLYGDTSETYKVGLNIENGYQYTTGTYDETLNVTKYVHNFDEAYKDMNTIYNISTFDFTVQSEFITIPQAFVSNTQQLDAEIKHTDTIQEIIQRLIDLEQKAK